MKRTIIAGVLSMMALSATAGDVFVYSPADGQGGLRIAVHEESGQWVPLGNGYDFVRSDP